jgi:hypothetical protein
LKLVELLGDAPKRPLEVRDDDRPELISLPREDADRDEVHRNPDGLGHICSRIQAHGHTQSATAALLLELLSPSQARPWGSAAGLTHVEHSIVGAVSWRD